MGAVDSEGADLDAMDGDSYFGGELMLPDIVVAGIGGAAARGEMMTQEPFQWIAGSEFPGAKGFGKS